jgi:hypothetical protein
LFNCQGGTRTTCNPDTHDEMESESNAEDSNHSSQSDVSYRPSRDRACSNSNCPSTEECMTITDKPNSADASSICQDNVRRSVADVKRLHMHSCVRRPFRSCPVRNCKSQVVHCRVIFACSMVGLKQKRELRSKIIIYDNPIVIIGKIKTRPTELTATTQDNVLWVVVMLWYNTFTI